MSKGARRKVDGDLTAMELAFCYEYLANRFNGTKAAINAGYSPDTARVQASDLLTRPNIQAKIKVLIDSHLTQLGVSASDVLRELVCMGFSDLRDYVTWSKEGGVQLMTSDQIGEKGAAIKEIEIEEIQLPGTEASIGKNIKIKLHDKKGPLELLGKHLGMFANELKVKHSGKVKATVDDSRLDLSKFTTSELRAWKKLMEKASGRGTVAANAGPAKR